MVKKSFLTVNIKHSFIPQRMFGVVGFFTSNDIPGKNSTIPMSGGLPGVSKLTSEEVRVFPLPLPMYL
jgi:hypothetical protein